MMTMRYGDADRMFVIITVNYHPCCQGSNSKKQLIRSRENKLKEVKI